ncbi:carboxypeptidase-like regulatory domain-containing protein [Edaphobacter aggregans]|uniref:carboxypeptidase-like regulatory domain-containing protein n=1 Tax=Edaphobacter aggregans TaxID=570835 RepID=UPI00054FDE6D|nr:carboxypeptidase-like regulatory domain-containing protein [Edaphobacter aggregans]
MILWRKMAGLILCLTLCVHLIAQSTAKSAKVSGHVVDPEGAVIGKANIYVRRNMPAEEKIELATHSDANGNFVLNLPAGAYDVLVTSVGFESKVQTILVRAGIETKTQWKLTVPSELCNFPSVNCDTFK